LFIFICSDKFTICTLAYILQKAKKTIFYHQKSVTLFEFFHTNYVYNVILDEKLMKIFLFSLLFEFESESCRIKPSNLPLHNRICLFKLFRDLLVHNTFSSRSFLWALFVLNCTQIFICVLSTSSTQDQSEYTQK
jgi:hypothetical protein